ncbi:MAG: sigma-70 family RNA polymerase sigma factor [Exilispira sp.]
MNERVNLKENILLLVKDIKNGNNVNLNKFLDLLSFYIEKSIINEIKKFRNQSFSVTFSKEDIKQNILIKILDNNFKIIRDINDVNNFFSYLYKMIRHEIYGLYKEIKSISSYNIIEEKNDEEKVSIFADQSKTIFYKGDQTDILKSEEIIKIINKFLDNITDKRNKIIFLEKLAGKPGKKIARELNLTESNVNTIFSRIYEKLVRIIEINDLNNIEINNLIINELREWLNYYMNKIKNNSNFQE